MRQLPSGCAGGQFQLDRLEESWIDDGLMLAAMDLAAIDYFADVETVAQKVSKGANAKANPATTLTIAADLAFGANASPVKVLQERAY